MESHRCPCCSGVVFASKYVRNIVVALPFFVFYIGLNVVRWTGHQLVDWMLVVSVLVVSAALWGLDALLPRSPRDDSPRDKWWRAAVVGSPIFLLLIAMTLVGESVLRAAGYWLWLLIFLALCASGALQRTLK